MSPVSVAGSLSRRILLPLALATLIVLPLSIVMARPVAAILLPMQRGVFETMVKEFRVTTMATENVSSHHVVRVEVTLAGVLVVGEHVMYPDRRGVAQASTPAAHMLHAVITALLVASAWPATGVVARLERSVLAFALSAWVAIVDPPSVLAGTLWQTLVEAMDPGRFSLLIAWSRFLEGGGRLLLGALAGAGAVSLAAALRLWRARSR